MGNRKTSKYILKDGNKILYVGITNDFDRRFEEHAKTKELGVMEKVGNNTTREAAEKWESERLSAYQKNHGGALPPLNKTKNGK
jgi:predicted GIY-YIG superfamily endonuclease